MASTRLHVLLAPRVVNVRESSCWSVAFLDDMIGVFGVT
jgi:hypothetical protein